MNPRTRRLRKQRAMRRRLVRAGEATIRAWRKWARDSGLVAKCQAQEDAPYEQSSDGWTGQMTCSACPVQIEGTVDGMHFYFRARHGAWTFSIGATQDDAVAVSMQMRDEFIGKPEVTWYTEGDDEDDGFMRHSLAWQEVRNSIAAWRKL